MGWPVPSASGRINIEAAAAAVAAAEQLTKRNNSNCIPRAFNRNKHYVKIKISSDYANLSIHGKFNQMNVYDHAKRHKISKEAALTREQSGVHEIYTGALNVAEREETSVKSCLPSPIVVDMGARAYVKYYVCTCTLWHRYNQLALDLSELPGSLIKGRHTPFNSATRERHQHRHIHIITYILIETRPFKQRNIDSCMNVLHKPWGCEVARTIHMKHMLTQSVIDIAYQNYIKTLNNRRRIQIKSLINARYILVILSYTTPRLFSALVPPRRDDLRRTIFTFAVTTTVEGGPQGVVYSSIPKIYYIQLEYFVNTGDETLPLTLPLEVKLSENRRGIRTVEKGSEMGRSTGIDVNGVPWTAWFRAISRRKKGDIYNKKP
ncbi:hypothetical protein APICC_02490 [Apis cerana cerana]|uniref:Uncharacterized protein n=1 Tax=Apis cerana cerana TaxID=94128 RepID=A0A2A3EJ63_APICC|nr:hypothetical protein APICC_02490 [Apis cerana cerana]